MQAKVQQWPTSICHTYSMQFKSNSTIPLHFGCSFTVPLITHNIAWRSEASLLLPELSWLTSCSGYQISHNQRASFKLISIAWKLYIIQFIYYVSPFMIHRHYGEILMLLWLCLVLWGCVRLSSLHPVVAEWCAQTASGELGWSLIGI